MGRLEDSITASFCHLSELLSGFTSMHFMTEMVSNHLLMDRNALNGTMSCGRELLEMKILSILSAVLKSASDVSNKHRNALSGTTSCGKELQEMTILFGLS